MNKKIVLYILTFLMIIPFICGCGKKRDVELDVDQLRKISNWVTLEAKYHNVAVVNKTAGTGLAHFGEVDRKAWIEYTGIIKIGVVADDIDMTVKGNKVKITMPKPSVLFINYKDYNENSFYRSKDSWFNKNKLEYTDVNEAMKVADEKMLEKVNSNQKLFDESKNNLEVLMRNYIEGVGELNGIKYEVTFSYK